MEQRERMEERVSCTQMSYRVTILVCYHGWVDLVLVVALSAWKGGNLEHPNQSQPNHVTNLSCHLVQGGTRDSAPKTKLQASRARHMAVA